MCLEKVKRLSQYILSLVGVVAIVFVLLEITVVVSRNASQIVKGTRGQRSGSLLHVAYVVVVDTLRTSWNRMVTSHALVRYEPYELWTSSERNEPDIHTDGAGFRMIPYDQAFSKDAKEVLVLGGSTLWGHRVSDDETIPAYMQYILGPGFHVFNMGELGFNSAQELNRMLRYITTIGVPDVVIFYDGFNDTYSGAFSPGIVRHHHHESECYEGIFEGNLLLAPLKRTQVWFLAQWLRRDTLFWNEKVKQTIALNAPKVLEVWIAHMRAAAAIGREYGFRVYAFWQPVIFSGQKTLTPEEQVILYNEPKGKREAFKAVYALAPEYIEHSGLSAVYDMSAIFEGERHTLYLDLCHITPEGNRIVAGYVVKRMLEQAR